MFWNKEVQRGAAAAHYLMTAQQKILDQYRASHSSEELSKDPSILAHLIRCPFPSDLDRCSDMFSHMNGGYDTTGYSLVVMHSATLEITIQGLSSC